MNAAAALLTEWTADKGYLESRYQQYLNSQILFGSSWYTKAVEEQGQEAADTQLAAWEARRRGREFSEAILPIAEGMLSLALADTESEYSHVAHVTPDLMYPKCHKITDPSKMVVIFNRQAPGCGCTQPKMSNLFAEYGSLGIKAITLQRGYTRQGGDMAMVGLVLPDRTLNKDLQNPNAFTVLGFDMEGHIQASRITPELSARGYLRFAMGLDDIDRAVIHGGMSGGYTDNTIGFPGATDFIADNLLNLAAYLKSLAEKLSTKHKH